MKRLRRFVLKKIGILLFLAVLLPLHADSRPPAGETGKIRLQLKWFHQFQFAGYYAALKKGFYDAAGLDVEILEGGPGVNVLDVVSRGEAEFGVLGSELAFHFVQGRDVVALAPVIQHSARAIIARADRGIASPHDLPGKSIMLNTNELPEFAAMFRNEGMNLEQLTIRPKDRSANQKFIRGEIDAMNGSVANQPFLFDSSGVAYNLIKPINYGIDFYGDTLFTATGLVREKPETVAAFINASLEGWRYAFEHPDEVADLILSSYSPKNPKPIFCLSRSRSGD